MEPLVPKPEPADTPDREDLVRERDALRIQAAAVAAQQAALTEEELCLEQRRQALDRQEAQLAAHLEEKRQHSLRIRKRLRAQARALEGAKQNQEAHTRAVAGDFERLRKEVKDAREAACAERQHLVELRQRFVRHWRRRWIGQKTELGRRAEQLAGERQTLERQGASLRREKADLARAQMRVNGEVELARRQLQAEREQLRQQAEQQRRLENEEHSRARSLDERERTLAARHQQFIEEQVQGQRTRMHLQAEIEGLENRIRQQRAKLPGHTSEVSKTSEVWLPHIPEPQRASSPARASVVVPSTPVPFPLPPHPTLSPEYRGEGNRAAPLSPVLGGESGVRGAAALSADEPTHLDVLELLSGDLADQRLQLAEQQERLTAAQEAFHKQRREVVAEMESLAVRLQEREQTVLSVEQHLAETEMKLRQRCEESAAIRRHLEGWQGRLAAHESAWEGERESLRARCEASERLLQRERQTLGELRRRWIAVRQRELDRVRAEQTRSEQLRRECASLREEWFRRSELLAHGQRRLAERGLAMEQYRLEMVSQAPDSVAAEKKLRKLQRRWESLHAASARKLAVDRQTLQATFSQLEERCRLIEEATNELAGREAEAVNQHTVWEHERASVESANAELRQEMQTLQSLGELHEDQIEAVRDEVERMARWLMDDGEQHSPLLDRAA